MKKNSKTNKCKKNFEIPLNPAKDINITRFTCLRFARQVSPPYIKGSTGQRGYTGSTGSKGSKGEPGADVKKFWCNLGSQNVITKRELSTKKNVILLDPGRKTWRQAYNICESICGALYFPSTRTENNEVYAIMWNYGSIWIRISDEEREGTWKDPDNKESLTFTNWYWSQPDSYGGDHDWGTMSKYSGQWYADSDSGTNSYIVCELT